jgi:hypothetical protein
MVSKYRVKGTLADCRIIPLLVAGLVDHFKVADDRHVEASSFEPFPQHVTERSRVQIPDTKQGCRNLIRDFRRLYFDNQNLTKKRCEDFFDNIDNFLWNSTFEEMPA